MRYIHIVDNDTASKRSDPDYDKLWKVRPLLDMFSKSALQMYSLHQQISIDESMIGTKCRLSFIQYMPKKPTKWGIKVWICSDAHTGYIYTFDVYTDANTSVPDSENMKGQAYNVVMKLMAPLLGKGHTVYIDNFYSSPHTFQRSLGQKNNSKWNHSN